MKIFMAIALVVLLSSCVTWNPTLDMTFQQFQDHFNLSDNYDPLRLVGDDGTTRVYETGDVFYYFVSGKLNRIDQGQLFEQRIQISVQ